MSSSKVKEEVFMSTILTLDLGTQTGWSLYQKNIFAGTRSPLRTIGIKAVGCVTYAFQGGWMT
jgi:hypothetical protein